MITQGYNEIMIFYTEIDLFVAYLGVLKSLNKSIYGHYVTILLYPTCKIAKILKYLKGFTVYECDH